MTVELLQVPGDSDWPAVADAARTTVGMEPGDGIPSNSWKRRILLAEHSPIRLLTYRWRWHDMKSWVSVHFVRHKIGIEHFVKSQRNDRTGVDRDSSRQDTLITHECVANAQAILNISRKRLCDQAHHETREAWEKLVKAIGEYDPVLSRLCVPECIYRGFCPEMKPCGLADSDTFGICTGRYRNV